uniref:Uncharacterized protein n=1 Tax=Megaselia scalaris TaxID=36166 RepID=T1GCD6_MEGSC
MLFLLISTLHMFCLCYADYVLFWLLARINYIGKKEAGLMPDPYITISVNGSGVVAKICRGIIKAFEPATEEFDIDPIRCLPHPYIPDYFEYGKIGTLLLAAWLLLFLEPFALRFRVLILSKFYPERDRERAVWLHSEILIERTSFIKLARRQIRSRILKDDSKKSYRCVDFIRAKTNNHFSEEKSVKCSSINCPGKYCKSCFGELLEKCFLCHKPIDYNDNSDISDELGSSEGEENKELKIE